MSSIYFLLRWDPAGPESIWDLKCGFTGQLPSPNPHCSHKFPSILPHRSTTDPIFPVQRWPAVNHTEMKTCPAMNLSSSEHRLPFWLLNVSVPDQSDDIYNSLRESNTRGRGRRNPREWQQQSSRGVEGRRNRGPGWPLPALAFTVSDTELFTSPALTPFCTGYRDADPAGSGSSASQEGGRSWGVKFKEKPLSLIIMTFIGDRWGHLLYRSNITPFSSHLIPFSLLINL